MSNLNQVFDPYAAPYGYPFSLQPQQPQLQMPSLELNSRKRPFEATASQPPGPITPSVVDTDQPLLKKQRIETDSASSFPPVDKNQEQETERLRLLTQSTDQLEAIKRWERDAQEELQALKGNLDLLKYERPFALSFDQQFPVISIPASLGLFSLSSMEEPPAVDTSNLDELEQKVLEIEARIKWWQVQKHQVKKPSKEPPRNKTHMDYLLEEAVWMATDFERERKHFNGLAKQFSKMVTRHHEKIQNKEVRAQKTELQMKVKLAAACSREIKKFWQNIAKLVKYKQDKVQEEEKKKKMGEDLENLVASTEALSRSVAGINEPSSPPPSSKKPIRSASKTSTAASTETNIASSKKKSATTQSQPEATEDKDVDFTIDEEEDDDEATLEAEEEDDEQANNREEELQDLEAEQNMPIEELMAKYYSQQVENEEEKEQVEEEIVEEEEEEEEIPQPKTHSAPEASHQKSEELRVTAAADLAKQIKPLGNTLGTSDVKTPIPTLLRHGSLREYQHIGLDWMVRMHDNNLNGILADEMGLGKTVMTISLLAYLAEHRGIWGQHLVIVPTSVMVNWEMEFKRWCPGFKILCYHGSPRERAAKRQGWNNVDNVNVVIASYQLVLQDQKNFRRKRWYYMILDEAHNIKNYQSQRWQALLNFNTERRLLLTGTPLQNNMLELWSLMHFLMPEIFQSQQEFKDWFSNPVTQMIEGKEKLDQELINRLHTVLRPFILRRLKKEVATQLPPKYEHVVPVRMSRRQRQLYEDFMSAADTKATLQSGSYLGMMNILMQLRKVCNHPDLFAGRPIVSPFDMINPLTYKVPSLCFQTIPTAFEPEEQLLRSELTLELFGFLLHSHYNKTANKWNADELSRLQTPANLISELSSSDYDHIDRSLFSAHSIIPEVPHASDPMFRSLLGPIRDGRVAWRKQRREHMALINQKRCSSLRAPLYGQDVVRLCTVYHPVLHCHALSQLPASQRNASLLKKHRSAQSSFPWEPSPSVLNAVKLPKHRAAESTFIFHNFMAGIPRARAPPMSITPSRPFSSYFQREQDRQNIVLSELSSPEVSEMYREPFVRLQMKFPDKRLLQWDCGKLQVLDTMFKKLKKEGHRVLVFTQMTKMLDVLEEFLNIHGHTYLRLDGSTKVDERQKLMEKFNQSTKYFCFILSTRSGGIGVNLTGADTVVFYDSDWNPAMDLQAQDRCHRIGQTREVNIYRLVTEDSVEENILKKSNQKRHMNDVVIGDGNFTATYMDKIDPRELLGLKEISSVETPDSFNISAEEAQMAMASVEDDADRVAADKLMQEQREDDAEFSHESRAQINRPWDADADGGATTTRVSVLPKMAFESHLNPVQRYALYFAEVCDPELVNPPPPTGPVKKKGQPKLHGLQSDKKRKKSEGSKKGSKQSGKKSRKGKKKDEDDEDFEDEEDMEDEEDFEEDMEDDDEEENQNQKNCCAENHIKGELTPLADSSVSGEETRPQNENNATQDNLLDVLTSKATDLVGLKLRDIEQLFYLPTGKTQASARDAFQDQIKLLQAAGYVWSGQIKTPPLESYSVDYVEQTFQTEGLDGSFFSSSKNLDHILLTGGFKKRLSSSFASAMQATLTQWFERLARRQLTVPRSSATNQQDLQQPAISVDFCEEGNPLYIRIPTSRIRNYQRVRTGPTVSARAAIRDSQQYLRPFSCHASSTSSSLAMVLPFMKPYMQDLLVYLASISGSLAPCDSVLLWLSNSSISKARNDQLFQSLQNLYTQYKSPLSALVSPLSPIQEERVGLFNAKPSDLLHFTIRTLPPNVIPGEEPIRDRVKWTPREDVTLLSAVNAYGSNWRLIADLLNADLYAIGRIRSARECQLRFCILQHQHLMSKIMSGSPESRPPDADDVEEEDDDKDKKSSHLQRALQNLTRNPQKKKMSQERKPLNPAPLASPSSYQYAIQLQRSIEQSINAAKQQIRATLPQIDMNQLRQSASTYAHPSHNGILEEAHRQLNQLTANLPSNQQSALPPGKYVPVSTLSSLSRRKLQIMISSKQNSLGRQYSSYPPTRTPNNAPAPPSYYPPAQASVLPSGYTSMQPQAAPIPRHSRQQ